MELTFANLYLIHQQGWQGAAEHLSHPQQIAWKSMCATQERTDGEGRAMVQSARSGATR